MYNLGEGVHFKIFHESKVVGGIEGIPRALLEQTTAIPSTFMENLQQKEYPVHPVVLHSYMNIFRIYIGTEIPKAPKTCTWGQKVKIIVRAQ